LHQHSPDHTEDGDTLVEVLIALVVIGLTAASILGAFATTLSATTEQRTLAKADAALRSFIEEATYDIRLSPPAAPSGGLPALPAFQGCPSSIPSQYNQIATWFNTNNPSYTVAITSVANVGTPCSTSTPSPQMITATLTTTSGGDDSLSFIVGQPDATPASISTSVTSINPKSGPAAGGTVVDIFGQGFTGVTAVNFGTTPGTSVTFVSDNHVIATSPAGSGTASVTVTTPAGTSSPNPNANFMYGPTVTKVASATGPPYGGTVVTITGTGFTAGDTVMFGANAATNVTFTSASSITATSPASTLGGDGVGAVDVTVTTAFGTSPPNPPSDQFTYGLSVTGVSPSCGSGSGGTPVDLLGSDFTGATGVDFGTTPATSFTVHSDSSITATAPGHANGIVDVTVTGPPGTSPINVADEYTYPCVTQGAGLGIVIDTGSHNPKVQCGSGSGSTCRTERAAGSSWTNLGSGSCTTSGNQTAQCACVMTGTSPNPNCAVSGIWQGQGPGTVTFYVELVDANGLPVVATSPVTVSVSNATQSTNPLQIPANASTTAPNTVTATLSTQNGSTNVTLSAPGLSMTVTLTQ
jgi:hypothetical protein